MATTTTPPRTALVTGICSGLGRAIATAFLASGINLVGCDITQASLDEFHSTVSTAHPNSQSLLVACDVTSSAGLDDLFAQAERVFGGVDYIVNSAGIMDKFDPVGDCDEAFWEKVLAVNLTAPARITKRGVQLMEKKEGERKGAIVNIASIAGTRGFSAGAAYTVSKHGLLGLTKNTAAFYGPKGIRCNAIMAGAMHTNIGNHLRNGMNMEGYTLMTKTFPPENTVLCDLDKMAKLVLYLCSDDASMVNGATLTADAGMTAN